MHISQTFELMTDSIISWLGLFSDVNILYLNLKLLRELFLKDIATVFRVFFLHNFSPPHISQSIEIRDS